jgi:hypothetical protein
MPETFFPAGIVTAFGAGVLGVFLAREFNIPYYLIILLGVVLTALPYPLLQLAGGVAIAVSIARLTDKYVSEVS